VRTPRHRLYRGLRQQDSEEVALAFGAPTKKTMVSWLATLNYVRNVAAQHARLFNRKLQHAPARPKAGQVPVLDHLRDEQWLGVRDKPIQRHMRLPTRGQGLDSPPSLPTSDAFSDRLRSARRRAVTVVQQTTAMMIPLPPAPGEGPYDDVLTTTIRVTVPTMFEPDFVTLCVTSVPM
jgi:hypothetical protein